MNAASLVGTLQSRQTSYRASLLLNGVLMLGALLLALQARTNVVPEHTDTVPTPRSTDTISLPVAAFDSGSSKPEQRRWLVGQLREMGVSEHVLAQFVLANLDAEWTKHAAEVALQSHGNSEIMAALQLRFDKSLDAEMRAALGPDGFMAWDRENMAREANAGGAALSSAESQTAYFIWKAFQARELSLKEARVMKTMDEADVAEAEGAALAAFNRQMKQLLGEQRYAQSQQTDPASTANSLRSEVAAVNPSDAQFQALLDAQKRLNEQQETLRDQFRSDPSSATYRERLNALESERAKAYEQILGPQNFDALQKSKDPAFHQMKQNQELWQLGDDEIETVYNTLQLYRTTVEEYQTEANARADRGEDIRWGDVYDSLRRFTEQTQQSLKESLGGDRYETLKRNNVFRFNEVRAPR